METASQPPAVRVALLTAGRDHPYAYGMCTALMGRVPALDIIGANDLDSPQWKDQPSIRFLNMRGDLSTSADLLTKASRVLVYYIRLVLYTVTTRANVFHILWNNKFETFDRVPLVLWYKLFGKRTLLTVHNVNTRARDASDSWFNRWTLKMQYRLIEHLFVHTEKMKQELVASYDVASEKVTVIPFGMNNAVPHTNLTPEEARTKLGLGSAERVILFFGNIAPYKGLEFLIDAFEHVMKEEAEYRLVIAGNPKNCDGYWKPIQQKLVHHPNRDRILLRSEFIPDEETEVYFKSADILVLPYRHIYQSGVLSLGYSFGLPVIATDVGALREDIVEGRTGYVCKPEDSMDLARTIEQYFSSELFTSLKQRRSDIWRYAHERYSWNAVGQVIVSVYGKLLGYPPSDVKCELLPH